MPDFSNMTFDELTKKGGYDCACGRHHSTDLEFLRIGRGVVGTVVEGLKVVGATKPMVIADQNTYKAAGEKVVEILEKHNIPYTLHIIPQKDVKLIPAEFELGSIVMNFDPTCDFLLAVGSGVVNDLTKMAGLCSGLKTGVVGTAPSMDGYASNSSSMEVNSVKTTIYNKAPSVIICDTEIMANAPMRMLQAGLGDMVAKYISVCEWRIANLVIGEYYCEDVAQLMRTSLKKIMANAGGIATRDPDAIGNIVEGLVLAGMAMSYAQVSRPASGLEHYFSHVWEMRALANGEHADLHGIQVGVGTLLTMKIYEKLKTITPDRQKALDYVAKFDVAAWEENVKRVFGATAGSVLAIEEKTHKNDPAKHAVRLEKTLAKWDEIMKIVEEELPDYQWLEDTMRQTGMPLFPKDLGLDAKQVSDAFVCARDIRDKFLSCSMIWDLGLMDEFAEWLESFN
ncbi:MAG: sn-glycerol-1-phosphate dehydrogenase [Clostridia bacterium]|nr:sn-glycerol-1-phosphate dehydrogenase [Clostridia bacterium]